MGCSIDILWLIPAFPHHLLGFSMEEFLMPVSNGCLPEEIKHNILEKIYGIAFVREIQKKKPIVTIPEFKFVIGRWQIKKKQWFKIAKELEDDGFVMIFKNFKGIHVKLKKIKP